MTIKIGDRLPDAAFTVMGPDGPGQMTTAEAFGGKKVALFAVPGAYTPTCHMKHMPGFLQHLDELKQKGVDAVMCTAVNDIFVLDYWARDTGAKGKVTMLADGNADFARKIGLEIDLGSRGFGVRSKRYAMLVDDGVVKQLNVENVPSEHTVSSAETMCSQIGSRL